MTDEEKECVKLWLEKPDMEFQFSDTKNFTCVCEGKLAGFRGGAFYTKTGTLWQYIRCIPEPKPVEMRYMTPLEAGDFALEHAREIEVNDGDGDSWSHSLAFTYNFPCDLKYRYRGQTEVHEFKVPKEDKDAQVYPQT